MTILKITAALFAAFMLTACGAARAQAPLVPERPANASTGVQMRNILASMALETREERIYSEVMRGNIPDFLRTFVPVTVTETIGGTPRTITYRVSPDYLALGSDADYFLIPMSPLPAQRLADRLGCIMPTRKMVDDIHDAAPVKLQPSPIPPSPQMTTVPVFWDHNLTVRGQRTANGSPLGTLVGGHKKDVVVTPRLLDPGRDDNVAIYGWHYPNGNNIQPLYLGHADFYADYSHGIRLIDRDVVVDGEEMDIAEVLAHPQLHALISDEGASTVDRYNVPLPVSGIMVK